MLGKTISHYQIIEKIGEGGMGVVYKAHDIRLERHVALKFLHPHLTMSEEKKERFVHEAKAAASLNHPNICTIHEVDEHEGIQFIVMEYVEGVTLRAKMSGTPIPLDEISDYAIQIVKALDHAFTKDIIHRDIKPENVMVDENNLIKVMDFGLAKSKGGTGLTQTHSTMGTFAYMSPEQLSGEETDQRTDMFSLGVMLYEMAAGKRPFEELHTAALFYSIMNTDPPPPSSVRNDITEEMDRFILTLLEKSPEKRFQSPREALQSLQDSTIKESGGLTSGFETSGSRSLYLGGIPKIYYYAAVLALLAGIIIILASPLRETALNLFGLSSIPEDKHIAILAIKNISGNPEDQSFCDGLAEMLASTITQMEGYRNSLWVVPTSEVRHAGIESAGQARKTLGANLVITGSVFRTDETISLTLNLIDAVSLRQLRSLSIKDSFYNLAAIQQKAINQISSMLEMELQPDLYRLITAGGTANPQAYDHYLRGLGYLQRFEQIDNIKKAIGHFSAALENDPAYARAFAGMGEAYWRKYDLTRDPKWIETAIRNCERAIAIDEYLPQVHVTLGIIYGGTGKFNEAVAEFKNALDDDPVNSDAYRELAGVYAAMGNTALAEATYHRAVELRPAFWGSFNELGKFYFRQGRFEDAEKQFRTIIELTPDNIAGYNNLGAVYYHTGRWNEARELFGKSISVRPNETAYSNLATMSYFEERYEEAARLYEELLYIEDTHYQTWGFLASSHKLLGAGRDKTAPFYKRAAELAEKQLDVNPHDALVICDLAGFYSALGDEMKAEVLLERALALDPRDIFIISRAGIIYESLGARNRALELIETALNKGFPASEIERNPLLKDLINDPRYAAIHD